jgi:ribonuclease HI
MKTKIKLYTDGSIVTVKGHKEINNVASYGYIVVQRNATTGVDTLITEKVHVVDDTTITEMELRAILEGVKYIGAMAKWNHDADLTIEVYSDSKMAVDAFNDYIAKWIKGAVMRRSDEWQATNGKPVAHQNIYKEILEATQGVNMKYIHVKSHKDSELNNRVDLLARTAVKERVELLMGKTEGSKEVKPVVPSKSSKSRNLVLEA